MNLLRISVLVDGRFFEFAHRLDSNDPNEVAGALERMVADVRAGLLEGESA